MCARMHASGTKIGPYVLRSVIGRGASGVVYEADDAKLRRKVALKVLSEKIAHTEEQRARFDREARLLAAVRHPNVAVVYGGPIALVFLGLALRATSMRAHARNAAEPE